MRIKHSQYPVHGDFELRYEEINLARGVTISELPDISEAEGEERSKLNQQLFLSIICRS